MTSCGSRTRLGSLWIVLWVSTQGACGGEADAPNDEVQAYVAALCDYVAQCGEVELSCADTPSGSSCHAVLAPGDVDECVELASMEQRSMLAGCPSNAPQSEAYTRCTEALDADVACVTQEELDAYYALPAEDRGASPELAHLPAPCRDLQAELEACAEADGARDPR